MADETIDHIENVSTKMGRKRQYENDGSEFPEAKKSTSVVQSIPTTRFLDLNLDCLEPIFDFLNPRDLLNIVISSTYAAQAALLVYSRRYSKCQVQIRPTSTSPEKMPIEWVNPLIQINSAVDCYKFLEIFGDLIKKLELYGFNDETIALEWRDVMQLVSQKCGGNLIELKVHNCNAFITNQFQNAFDNVDKLHLQRSYLDQCKRLNEWFPNVKSLELIDIGQNVVVEIISPHFFTMHLEPECLSASDIGTMIESAPQLQDLTLSGFINVNYLRFINQNLPVLKRLNLKHARFFDESNEKCLLENVESFSIDLWTTIMPPIELPFEFRKLTELQVKTNSFEKDWIDFAINQTGLLKLRLDMNFDVAFLDPLFSQCKMLHELRIVASDEIREELKQKKMSKLIVTEDDKDIIVERMTA